MNRTVLPDPGCTLTPSLGISPRMNASACWMIASVSRPTTRGPGSRDGPGEAGELQQARLIPLPDLLQFVGLRLPGLLSPPPLLQLASRGSPAASPAAARSGRAGGWHLVAPALAARYSPRRQGHQVDRPVDDVVLNLMVWSTSCRPRLIPRACRWAIEADLQKSGASLIFTSGWGWMCTVCGCFCPHSQVMILLNPLDEGHLKDLPTYGGGLASELHPCICALGGEPTPVSAHSMRIRSTVALLCP